MSVGKWALPCRLQPVADYVWVTSCNKCEQVDVATQVAVFGLRVGLGLSSCQSSNQGASNQEAVDDAAGKVDHDGVVG